MSSIFEHKSYLEPIREGAESFAMDNFQQKPSKIHFVNISLIRGPRALKIRYFDTVYFSLNY